MNNDQYEEFIVCDCHSPEHLLKVTYFDDDISYAYIQIHLNPAPFWERIRQAVKYVLGHRSKYGEYDEFVIGQSNIDKLHAALTKIKERMDENTKQRAQPDDEPVDRKE